nr:ribonuclease H-like domain-containing protein [Tanacetum cinerariifolium]
METAKDKGLAGEVSASTKKKGRTVAITAEDMQKRKNDVKARTTLLLALPDEHQSPMSQDRRKKESYKKDSNVKEPAPKAMIAIDGIGWIGVIWLRKMKLQRIKLLWPMKKKLLESQKLNKDKKGVGFNEYYDVPPPHAQVYSPHTKDLSWMGLPEFVDDTVTDYTRPIPSIDVSKSVSKELEERWKRNNPFFFEQGGSSGNVVSKPMIKFVKEFGCPNATKVNNIKNARKPTVKYAEMHRNISQSPRVRRNKRNWNNQKSQQLGKDFMMQNKACYNCGSFDHLKFNCKHDICVDKGKTWTRVNHAQDNMKYITTHKSMTPRVVLLKSGIKPIAINRPFSTTRPTLNSAQLKMTSFIKTTHLNVNRPFERKSTAKNKVWVPTVRPKIPIVGSKVPAAKPKVAADKGNKGKAVKASARRIWKPKQNSSGQGIPQNNNDDKRYWDSGCSRHMTGNISYLSEYEPFKGGYVSFGHGRGKITGKGSIKTGKLEFENVYFVEELKYNLFSVSQICDNKNSVLFTDTKCLVLGKDFKLVDDKHVFLRTPRQQNMYTIDLKNVAPHKNLTCLIAKALVDESMFWHRRLGHLNFKTMNKLVRGNLLKGLPSKSFKNDHSCVACLKGKQHKASHNTDFHQIVDFLEASHIRVKTTDGETKVLAKVNGRQRTVSESLIRRHLKLNDEEDETAFPIGDVRYGEAFPTVTRLDAGMQQKLQELMDIYTSLQRQHSLIEERIQSQDLEITHLKTKVRTLKDNEKRREGFAAEDAPNTGGGSRGGFLARDLEAKFSQEDQIIREQAERDSEIARIHAERELEMIIAELEMMIAELDRSNKIVAKYLSEYEQAEAGLSHDEKVELIDELLMYQRNLAQIKNVGKNARFCAYELQVESERLKRPGIQLGKESFKKLKTDEVSGTEPSQEQQFEEPKELSDEELKKMMGLVPVEELYIEALHVKYPIID